MSTKHIYTLYIHYMNGSKDELPFDVYSAVRDYYQNNISYSGGRVKRVEVGMNLEGSLRAIWDIAWHPTSQQEGLRA